MKHILATIVLLVVSLGAQAAPFDTFTLTGSTVTGIGNSQMPTSPYDQLKLTGSTGNITSDPFTGVVGVLDFLAGVNEYSGQDTPTLGQLAFTFAINGGPIITDFLKYSWTSPGAGYTDVITFDTPASIVIGKYNISFFAPATMRNSGGVVSTNLIATIVDPVPEASTFVMLAIGLLAFGFSQKKSTVTA